MYVTTLIVLFNDQIFKFPSVVNQLEGAQI